MSLKETIEFWQPYSRERLTEEDAREIEENLVGFFTTLMRWDAEAKSGTADQSLTATSDRTIESRPAPAKRRRRRSPHP